MCHRVNLLRLLIGIFICLFLAFCYGGVFSIPFLGDDLGFLHHVARGVREGCSLSQLLDEWFAPPHRGGFFYRPLVFSSFLGDYLMYGVNPMGWHFTSLLLHLFNAALLGWLVEQIAGGMPGRGATITGGAAAAIFALRPCSPETVVWLSGRNDELVLLGFLVAFLAYLHAKGRWGPYYLLALGGFIFALGGKEAGVTLPGGLLCLHLAGVISTERHTGENDWVAWVRQTLTGIGPFAIILISYFIFRFIVFGTPFKVYQDIPPIDLNSPAWRAVKLHALRFFLAPGAKMTFWPKCFLFVTSMQVLVGLMASWHSIIARRIWVFGMFWLMVSLLPLAPFLLITPTGEGGRLLYVSGAALAVVMVAPIVNMSAPSRPGKGLSRHLSFIGAAGVVIVVFLSVPLLKNLLQPWLEAGRSMKALPAAIAARAEMVPEGGYAILLIPDHLQGALFGRNGQGTLMDPPIQSRPLIARVLVVTPPTLGQHAPRLAASPRRAVGLEYWCWNLEGRYFKRLTLRDHPPGEWLDAWEKALHDSGCLTLAEELATFYGR